MKKLILLSIVLIFSCSKDPIIETETVSDATFQTKAKPNRSNFFNGGVATQDIIIDGNGKNLVFDNFSNISFTNFYYMRTETVKDEFSNIGFLQEINSRDYKVQVNRGGKGSFFWMDSNPGNANILLDINEDGGYRKFHVNNQFIQPSGLSVFETVAEAKAAGVYGMFKNSLGILMTTR